MLKFIDGEGSRAFFVQQETTIMNFSVFFEKIKQKEWQKTFLSGMVFFLLPVVIFYLMEFYEHNPFAEVREEAQFFNILLMELLAWSLFFLLGSGKWASRILALLAMTFGLVNHYVMAFRSTPFVPWDLFSVKTAASVAGNYDFTPGMRVIVVTLLFLALIVLVHFLHFDWKRKFAFRILPLAGTVLVLGAFTKLLQNENFQNRHYLYPFLFTPVYMTDVNGMAVTFAMNLAYVIVDKPAGYREEDCRELLEQYEKAQEEERREVQNEAQERLETQTGMENEAQERLESQTETENGTQNTAQEQLPNIIVIMDEAFSDLAVLGELSATEDYMPFVHSLQQGKDHALTGYLNVSVCGGNTANTEFEFLTGNTMAFLPAGSIPYQQYIKQEIPSLASYLKWLGYDTYAMHPYPAEGWNREDVYPRMGFETMYFLPDYRRSGNLSYVRNYVSDRSDFRKIIDTYEKKEKGQPLFVFNVTMQNHGSYTKEYSNFTANIMAEGTANPLLNRYLSLVRLTDQALEELVSYFREQDEKTLIVFFGDHQPNDSVAGALAQGGGEELRYEVPYLIWANFDLEEAQGGDTSANYLAAQVLQAAGVPLSPYQDFLMDVREHYPILSAVRMETADEEEKLMEDYRKLQYYLLFDWKEESE